jgi:hypothetical protein
MNVAIFIAHASLQRVAYGGRGLRTARLGAAGLCCILSVLMLSGPVPAASGGAEAMTPVPAVTTQTVVSPPLDFSGDPVYGPSWAFESECAIAFNGTDYLVVWGSRCDRFMPAPEGIYGTRVDQSGAVLDDGMIPVSAGPGEVGDPAVASDGTDFLVVWKDSRAGGSHIYGTRVDASGNVLDAGGIMISSGPDYELSPSVAFDGTNYLVVWVDGGDYDIHGARVAPSGAVLDPGGVVISAAAGNQVKPDVAFGGTNYLVVWEDERNGSPDIYGARVNPSGAVLDPAGIPVAIETGNEDDPAAAFGDTAFLVVWRDNSSGGSDIHGARVAQGGSVMDPGGVVITDAAGSQRAPDVAFDGTNFGVTWEDYRSTSGIDVYLARVSPTAVVLDTAGIPIFPSSELQLVPAVAFDGTNYMVSCEYSGGSQDIVVAQVAPSGTVLGLEWKVLSTEENRQLETAASFDGVNYLVVWEDGRNGSWDIYGTRVDPTGSVLDPDGILIGISEAELYSPSVAFDGTNYLVVWEESGAGIVGARVTPSGAVLDPGGVVIAAGPGERRFPAVAFGGTNYMVVWDDDRGGSYDVYGARVTPSGTVLDPGGIVVSDAAYSQQMPELAFDGTNYLVAWEDIRDGHDRNVYGARVTTSGTVLDPAGLLIAGGMKSQGGPSVAFDGTNYMVVWVHDNISLMDIHGARVDPSGAVLDATPIVVSSAGRFQQEPTLIFNGSDYVAAWTDRRNATPDIYIARIDPSGAVLDPSGILMPAPPGGQINPAIASGNAVEMLVAYSSNDRERLCGLQRIMGNLLNPPLVLEATVELDPTTLNLKSKGKYVTAYVELPEPYDAGDVDVATVVLNGVLHAETSPTSVGDEDADGVPDRMLKFSRGGLIDLISGHAGGNSTGEWSAGSPHPGSKDDFEVTVAGELTDGTRFAGTDILHVLGHEADDCSLLSLDVVPNVFKDMTRISYEVPSDGPVIMRVFDVLGRLVRTLESGPKPTGGHVVSWDRTAEDGSRVGAGVYFIRVEHQGLRQVRKVLVVQ